MIKHKLIMGIGLLGALSAFAGGGTKYRWQYDCYTPITKEIELKFSAIETVRSNGSKIYALEPDASFYNSVSGSLTDIKIVSSLTIKGRKAGDAFDFQAVDSRANVYTFDAYYNAAPGADGEPSIYFTGQGNLTYPVMQGYNQVYENQLLWCVQSGGVISK